MPLQSLPRSKDQSGYRSYLEGEANAEQARRNETFEISADDGHEGERMEAQDGWQLGTEVRRLVLAIIVVWWVFALIVWRWFE